jgi:hypothetical protein
VEFIKNCSLSVIPLIVLYLISETILSTINLSPFVPLPEISPPVKNTRISPWGDSRIVKERIYLGAPAIYEEHKEGFAFRAFVPQVDKRPGIKRIVFIGDSLMFGTGVAEYETLPFYVSGYVRYYSPELSLEMVNLGVPGADIQTYVRLGEIGSQYQPDLVILGFSIMNDGDTRTADAVEEVIPDSRKTTKQSMWEILSNLRNLRDFIATHSRTVSALYRPIRRLEARGRRDVYMENMYDNETNWAKIEESLVKISANFRSKCVPTILIIFPYQFASRYVGLNDIQEYKYVRYHAKIAEAARRHNFIVIDLIEYFKGDSILSFDNYIVDGDGHPNGSFNAFVARHFARELIGYLKG